MNFSLYCHIASAYCHKAILAFYEKGVDFTPIYIDLSDKVASAEYKKIYPLGKIPLLTNDQGGLYAESTNIVEYLECEFPGSGTRLIPENKTAARRARGKDRMFDLYLNDPLRMLYYEWRKPIEERNTEVEARNRSILDTVYEYEEKKLESNTFLSGNEFSIADCSAFGPLFWAQRTHPWTNYPNISAYYERMLQRPSVKRLLIELLPELEK